MKRNTKNKQKSIIERYSRLINKDGSINITTFYTLTGKWQVVGSSITHDECYNRKTGERIYRTRKELKTLEEQGHIFDVGK